jgi:hypothetical protein
LARNGLRTCHGWGLITRNRTGGDGEGKGKDTNSVPQR